MDTPHPGTRLPPCRALSPGANRRLLLALLATLGACTVEPGPNAEGGPASRVTWPSDPLSWPSRCDLASVKVPSDLDPLAAACVRLYYAAGVKNRNSFDPWFVPPPGSFVDSCIALAGAPGSRVTPADIEACAARTCSDLCSDAPPCVGTNFEPLFPGHDWKGTLAPGATCAANLQCDTGYCTANLYQCGTCKRYLNLGDPCAERPGEPAGVNVCVGSQCVDGTCQLTGLPDGTPCGWKYGFEGCKGRCLQPDFKPPGMCAPLGGEGEWCGGANNPECKPGLACVVHQCEVLLPDGAACNPNVGGCVHQCIAGTCGRPPCGRMGLGEDCTLGTCLAELRCVDGRCQPPLPPPDMSGAPDLGKPPLPRDAKCLLGDTCSAGQGCWATCSEQGCLADHTACLDIPTVGDPCLAYGECLDSNNGCYRASAQEPGKCLPRGNEGDPCPCKSDTVCKNGRCIAFGPAACE